MAWFWLECEATNNLANSYIQRHLSLRFPNLMNSKFIKKSVTCMYTFFSSFSIVTLSSFPQPSKSSFLLIANLALKKPTFIKKLYQENGTPFRAVDGNTNPDRFKAFSCAAGAKVPQGWWAVDLGATYSVGKVRLLSRMRPECKYSWITIK